MKMDWHDIATVPSVFKKTAKGLQYKVTQASNCNEVNEKRDKVPAMQLDMRNMITPAYLGNWELEYHSIRRSGLLFRNLPDQ